MVKYYHCRLLTQRCPYGRRYLFITVLVLRHMDRLGGHDPLPAGSSKYKHGPDITRSASSHPSTKQAASSTEFFSVVNNSALERSRSSIPKWSKFGTWISCFHHWQAVSQHGPICYPKTRRGTLQWRFPSFIGTPSREGHRYQSFRGYCFSVFSGAAH